MSTDEEDAFTSMTNFVDLVAEEGLRTLFCAKREI